MRALLDANVLYPTVMREVLLGVAAEGMFAPLWSTRILEEWARAARRLGPEAEAFARGEIAAELARFPRATVEVPPGLERRLRLPDPDDVHVLAAAVAGSANVVVTMNARDFPRDILAEEGLRRLDPDQLLRDLAAAHPEALARVVARSVTRARELSGEPWTARTLLRKARLPQLARAVERREGVSLAPPPRP